MGAARRTRRSCSRGCSTTPSREHRPEARWLRGGFWRNFQVKYREINDLHKQMLRTSRKVAAMPEGPGGRRARPPPPRPVQRLLLARAVRRDLHLAHAPRHLRAPDRRGGRGRPRCSGRPTRRRCGPRHGRPRRGAARRRGPGRDGQAVRGRRDRRLGHPRRPPRARGRAPAPARGLPRDAARPRGERRPPAPGRRPTRATAATAASIHDIVMVKEEGLAGRLHYDDHERRSGLVRFLAPTTRRPRRSRPPPRRSSATSATASGRSTTSRRARSRCRATGRRSASGSR